MEKAKAASEIFKNSSRVFDRNSPHKNSHLYLKNLNFEDSSPYFISRIFGKGNPNKNPGKNVEASFFRSIFKVHQLKCGQAMKCDTLLQSTM